MRDKERRGKGGRERDNEIGGKRETAREKGEIEREIGRER